jgi:hypothetical protein
MRQMRGPKEESCIQHLQKFNLIEKLCLSDVCASTLYVYHLQISEHAHRGLFLVGVEETIRIPFVTVGSPNLGQAVPRESRVHISQRS